jgi:hypothetical protein
MSNTEKMIKALLFQQKMARLGKNQSGSLFATKELKIEIMLLLKMDQGIQGCIIKKDTIF